MRAQLLAAEGSAPPSLVALTYDTARRLFDGYGRRGAGYGTRGPLRIHRNHVKDKMVKVEEDQLVNEMRARLIFERIQRQGEPEEEEGVQEAMGFLGLLHAMGG